MNEGRYVEMLGKLYRSLVLNLSLRDPTRETGTEFVSFSRTAVKSGIVNGTIRSLFLLPFLFPARKCGKQKVKETQEK
jgi:hypothetical protein